MTETRDHVAYPPARRDASVLDDYHGTPVADPYRWLEDPDSHESRVWVEAQNRVTEAFLADIPARSPIRARLEELWDYERYGLPFRKGQRYFYSRNDGLQAQAVLYVAESLDSEPRLLLDPNTLSEDGTVALVGMSVSEDGELLAYGLARAGSDWQEWRVRDVAAGVDRDDTVRWVKFSGVSWLSEGWGFFYSRYDEPSPGSMYEDVNRFQKLYLHRLGTDQSVDELIYHRPDQPDWGFDGTVTDDGRYLVVSSWEGTDSKSRIFYKDLSLPGGEVTPLLDAFDAQYSFIDNDGPWFWFQTDKDAPRGRVVGVNVREPSQERWREIIPESNDTLEGVGCVGESLFAIYLHDASTRVMRVALDGTPLGGVELPGIGTAMGFGGRRNEMETFYAFTNATEPTAIYRYDTATGQSTVFRRPITAFDPAPYETRQVFYGSKDGTKVPMFVTCRKDVILDGSNPTYLYGYGGFRIPMVPGFSVSIAGWLEMGGVYAMACLRGGGEYGEEWHQAGMKERKQNVFDDYIAAAEWLIAEGYTTTPKLAIGGGSNGGLLVGACMTQRPDLFGACLPAVGVMDMLRFHKFTIGWAWISDYGSPDDPEMFPHIRAYSPLHNLRPGTVYPPTMILTADHDDRVVPAHSFKFAAELQYAESSGSSPALIRIETRAGHGMGKPTAKLIDEAADSWAFLSRVLEMELPEYHG